MNILFLSNIAAPYQLDFLEELNNHDEIQVFGYFLFSKEKNRDWNLKLPSYVIVANFRKNLADYISLYKFIQSKKIEKIIIGGYTLPTTFFLIALSKLFNKELFFWLERPMHEHIGFKKYLKECYLKYTLSKARKIFAIGELAVNFYKKYNPNVANLPYSMNLEKFYTIDRSSESSKNTSFLFSGQFIDRKNIINTLNAFKSVNDETIRLNIIGGGDLKEAVADLIKNDSRIKNLGFIQPDELHEIYKQNDVFLMPSKHDGWALVINEAMASAMPVISTPKVGAVDEFIKHRVNGFVCDIDITSISEGIEYYLTNNELIKQHALKNREIIKKSLGDVKNAANFLVNELKK